jgi:DNA polymerase epsilon subunit 1
VVSYPCSMLNAQTHHDCENPQYHTLVNEEKQEYSVHKECSILFELDGPYKAMILPAAKEEGKRLKKRYAVFNFDGSLAELKGFELKRRGELQLVKVFQSEVFKRFLDGGSLEECYTSVAAVANQWLDVLDNKGVDLEDDELIDLISESTNMSKSMEEYEGRKSMAITTATRIAEFLGADMIKDKGLNCTYVVSRTPEGTPVTERAVPVGLNCE